MPLPVKSAQELVTDQVTAMQAISEATLDFTVGSVFRAIVESNMGNSLWLQALISFLLSVTRLSTSTGTAVDTFIQDFGMFRIPAVAATGSVTFSRFTFTQEATIRVGTIISAVVNGVSYTVTADATNPYYDPDLNAYVIPANTQAITVPIIANTAGLVGNVLSNQITTINTVLVNVDSVTNAQPLTNGADQESDAAVKVRFVLYLASLFRATRQALEFAITSVTGVKRFLLVENKDVNGNPYLGFFFAVIDDGTGNASGPLIGSVQAALESYRGFTIAYSVYAPIPVPVDITMEVTTDGTVDDSIVEDAVVASLENFTTAQKFLALFAYSRVPSLAYNANSTITDVANYTLNGGTSDVQLTGREIFTVGTFTVLVNP